MKNYSLIAIQESLVDTKLREQYENEREYIFKALKDNKYLQTTPEEFLESISHSKHPKMLSSYDVESLMQMRIFKVKGFDIGYALKPYKDTGDYEIVAVHNNSPVSGVGDAIVQSAIRNGGKYLDHFSGMLDDLYGRNDFEEYHRDEYNPEYDPEGEFAKQYGQKPVIYRRHKSAVVPNMSEGATLFSMLLKNNR